MSNVTAIKRNTAKQPKFKQSSRKRATWEDRFADKFIAQPAQLTIEQVGSLEARFSGADVDRRVALMTLTKSGAELIEVFSGKRKGALVFARVADDTAGYATLLRHLADLMDTASVRLNLALCSRDDMQAILDEVKAVDSGHAVGHG